MGSTIRSSLQEAGTLLVLLSFTSGFPQARWTIEANLLPINSSFRQIRTINQRAAGTCCTRSPAFSPAGSCARSGPRRGARRAARKHPPQAAAAATAADVTMARTLAAGAVVERVWAHERAWPAVPGTGSLPGIPPPPVAAPPAARAAGAAAAGRELSLGLQCLQTRPHPQRPAQGHGSSSAAATGEPAAGVSSAGGAGPAGAGLVRAAGGRGRQAQGLRGVAAGRAGGQAGLGELSSCFHPLLLDGANALTTEFALHRWFNQASTVLFRLEAALAAAGSCGQCHHSSPPL
jgi:hypothetical protein